MAVKIYQNGAFHMLAGAKVYHNGAWVTLSAMEKVYLDNSWHYLGAVSSFVTISNETRNVSAGFCYISTTINTGGSMCISSGGMVKHTIINDYGDLLVSSGGIASRTIVNGFMLVYSGGTANNTTVNTNGRITVSPNGKASSITIKSFGSAYVTSGSIVNNIVIESYGKINGFTVLNDQTMNRFGTLKNVIVYGNDIGHLYAGQVASNVNVSGSLQISGGVVMSAVFYGNRHSYINGGEASNITLNPSENLINGYDFHVENGVVSSVNISSGGFMTISSGGRGNDITVNPTGGLEICSGGIAENITVSSTGFLRVSTGGIASNVTSQAGATIIIQNGGTITYA